MLDAGVSPVAVNATIVGNRPTGFAVWCCGVVAGLAGLGERVVVYSARRDCFEDLGVDVRLAPAGVSPDRGVWGHSVRALWLQTGLRRRLSSLRAAVLLNPVHEGLIRSPVPQITTIHDLLPLQFHRGYWRLRHYFRYWVPLLLRSSEAVITVSEASRRELLRTYGLPGDRVHVTGAGYDSRRFRPDGPRASRAEPYALYVGNLWPHKNLLRMVEAFAKAVGRGRGELVIRGWGRRGQVKALQGRIARNGLEARVDWQPYASPDELPKLYRGARVLLLPSLAEGFGLTALEAMACGTPVVASKTASIPEVVGDAGLLVDPYDTGELAEAIRRVFQDDGLAAELRDRGLARAPRFSWERVAVRVRTVIRTVLGRNCTSVALPANDDREGPPL